MPPTFDIQGHRGARGLRPENTLPSFEIALDHGVTSIETDLHLSKDGVVIVCHDPQLTGRLCSQLPFTEGVPIHQLTLEQLRTCRADRNPDPQRFPDQSAELTPVAARFAGQHGIDPYGLPTLADLFAFADAYAGSLGEQTGKIVEQRGQARRVIFDLELKRVPFHPEAIGDDFRGTEAGRLEWQVIAAVRAACVQERTRVRSFDHRCVRALREVEPRVEGAVLMAETAVVDPVEVAHTAAAAVYCPHYSFLDEVQVRQLHDAGLRVIPWTANTPDIWDRLLNLGVDGITTDYPDRLAEFLRKKNVTWTG